jgi:hypothetical protein
VIDRRCRSVVAGEDVADRHHRRDVAAGGPSCFDDDDVRINDADLDARP